MHVCVCVCVCVYTYIYSDFVFFFRFSGPSQRLFQPAGRGARARLAGSLAASAASALGPAGRRYGC